MRTSIDQELRDLEGRYWDAVQRKDGAAASEMSDEPCIVVGARGVGAVAHDKLAQMLEHASYDIKNYELDEQQLQIRQISDDVAIVAYPVHEDLVVDGKDESIEAYDASVWVRRDGQWRCALHTQSLKGDPFGRQDVNRLMA